MPSDICLNMRLWGNFAYQMKGFTVLYDRPTVVRTHDKYSLATRLFTQFGKCINIRSAKECVFRVARAGSVWLKDLPSLWRILTTAQIPLSDHHRPS